MLQTQGRLLARRKRQDSGRQTHTHNTASDSYRRWYDDRKCIPRRPQWASEGICLGRPHRLHLKLHDKRKSPGDSSPELQDLTVCARLSGKPLRTLSYEKGRMDLPQKCQGGRLIHSRGDSRGGGGLSRSCTRESNGSGGKRKASVLQ